MDTRITLDMTVVEAILTLDALNKASAEAFRVWRRLLNTDAPQDEQDIAKQSAAILARVSAGLSRSLYPGCSWMDNDACEAIVVGRAENGLSYCRRHMAVLESQIAQLAALA